MAGWTMAVPTRARQRVSERPEAARVELVTNFGTGASALRPFDGASRVKQRRRRGAPGASLGELLVSEGLLTDENLTEALREQKRTRPKERLGEILLRQGLVAGPSLVRLLAWQCELTLDLEDGFGSGLRNAIESRHQAERTTLAAPSRKLTGAKRGLGRAARGARAAADYETSFASARGRRLGELLVQRRLLTGVELEQALCDQEDSGRLLGEILVERGCVSVVTLMNMLAEQTNGELERIDGFGSGLRDAVETQFLLRREQIG